MHRFPDIPPVWTALALLLSWALAALLPVGRFGWGALPGIGLALAGLALILWAALWFRRKRTTIHPHGEPTALITEGPYALNRNPIYTGFVLVAFGWAFWLGALAAFLPALALPLLLTRRFILPEERALRLAFGPEAERYFRATRRW